MKKEEFLQTLEISKGKNLIIEIEGKILQKITMQKYEYKIEEDKLYLKPSKFTTILYFDTMNIITLEKE